MRRISFQKQGHSDSKMNTFKSKCFLIELELAINVKYKMFIVWHIFHFIITQLESQKNPRISKTLGLWSI